MNLAFGCQLINCCINGEAGKRAPPCKALRGQAAGSGVQFYMMMCLETCPDSGWYSSVCKDTKMDVPNFSFAWEGCVCFDEGSF